MGLPIEALRQGVDTAYGAGGGAYTGVMFSKALNSQKAYTERRARHEAECQEAIAQMRHPGLDTLADEFKRKPLTGPDANTPLVPRRGYIRRSKLFTRGY